MIEQLDVKTNHYSISPPLVDPEPDMSGYPYSLTDIGIYPTGAFAVKVLKGEWEK